ncbi:hypothetical protein [uncultured Agrobacterium sp.]|uniref:hypothetical protein n=1 Tax=uncultured Agrobacterium sp. TaxID=157277 RepID=UPI0025FB29C2|nr:hypothetical protein [uncultured Agrobacterium sp.]
MIDQLSAIDAALRLLLETAEKSTKKIHDDQLSDIDDFVEGDLIKHRLLRIQRKIAYFKLPVLPHMYQHADRSGWNK